MTTAQDIELIEIVSTPAFTGRVREGGGERNSHRGSMTTAQDIELIEIVSTQTFTGKGGGEREIHTGAR